MPEASSHAPGRVELLGNHTDYNEGYVLSAAINHGVTMRGDRAPGDLITLRSSTMEGTCVASLGSLQRSEEHPWANYPLGVVDAMARAGHKIGGWAAGIESDLPVGAGLSSSAALEVATGTLLAKLFDLRIEPLEMAKLCRRAENDFVGVNCGLLDQVSSVFGRRGHAIFLDCRQESVETVPFPAGVELLIAHSGVKHALVGGEYNERRAQCFDAAQRLGVPALRDVTGAQLEAAKDSLPPLSYRRALHIVGENERVLGGIEFLRGGDVAAFGQLMFASHASSRLHFENSTPELDALVGIAAELPGVLGSRLTGGGFGGATVSLVRREASAEIGASLTRLYGERTGHHCQIYVCEIADGAR